MTVTRLVATCRHCERQAPPAELEHTDDGYACTDTVACETRRMLTVAHPATGRAYRR